MGGKAEFVFRFDTEEEAEAVFLALKPELESAPSDRTSVALNRDGSELFLTITSDEGAPFRAALSAHLRWIKMISELRSI